MNLALIKEVKIFDGFSFFEAPAGEAERILSSFQGNSNGRSLVSRAKEKKPSGDGGGNYGGGNRRFNKKY